jgi:hypothetical protein
MTDHPIEDLLGVLPDQVRPDDAVEARLRARLMAELAAAPGSTTDPATMGAPLATDVMELDTMTKVPAPPAHTAGRWLLIAAAVAIVAILAAVAVTDRDEASDVAMGSARTVFDDGFDDDSSGWITEQTTGITVETGGGRQTWRLTAAGASDVQRPLTLREQVLDTEVVAEVDSISPGATLGVLCRKGLSAPSDSFYSFRLGPAGASIFALGGDAGDRMLASDPSVAVPEGPFEVVVRCVDDDGVAQLQMAIDGEDVLTATDDVPLPAGVGAIEVQNGTDPSVDGEIVLDRLVVREIG